MANDSGMKKVLTSKQEIMEYAGISKYLYAKFIKLGMPVLYVDGRCLAHKDNIDDFFKLLTRVSAKNVPDDVINAEDEDKKGS
jgi:hypothetical protein